MHFCLCHVAIVDASALRAATPADQLVEPGTQKRFKGISASDISQSKQEMPLVRSRFKLIKPSYRNDVLNIVLARGYLAKLLSNTSVGSYLQRPHPELHQEFREIVNASSLEEPESIAKVA
jgi:hypothetical protein